MIPVSPPTERVRLEGILGAEKGCDARAVGIRVNESHVVTATRTGVLSGCIRKI